MQQVTLDKHNLNNTDIGGISDIWIKFLERKQRCYVMFKPIKGFKMPKSDSYFQFSVLYRVFIFTLEL